MSVVPAPDLGQESTSKYTMGDWFDAVGDVHTRLTFRNDSDRQFSGTMSTSSFGELRACSFRGTALTASRTERDIARSPEGSTIMIWQFRGRSLTRQRDQENLLEPGSLAFLDLDVPYEVKCSDEYGQLVIHLPTDILIERLRAQGVRRDFRGVGLSAVPQSTPWLAFLGNAFSQAQLVGAAAMSGLYMPAVEALASLAGLSLGKQDPDANTSVLLRSALSIIGEEYWRPDFTAEFLAGRLHISRRTLFRILDEAQVSLTETLQEARLGAAVGMLGNPACSLTIEAIGLAVGYQSTSTFHARFRGRFGQAPGAYRRQALASGTLPQAR